MSTAPSSSSKPWSYYAKPWNWSIRSSKPAPAAEVPPTPQVPATDTVDLEKDAQKAVNEAGEKIGEQSKGFLKKYIKPFFKSIKNFFKSITNRFKLTTPEKVQEALEKQIAKANLYELRKQTASAYKGTNEAQQRVLQKELQKTEAKQGLAAQTYQALQEKYAKLAGEEAASKAPKSELLENILKKAAQTVASKA